MAVIRPFRGLRYSADSGPLESLVAPPYDVLTPSERDGYAARNPHNIVHLTLPESRDDDRSKFVKYARSAALLAEWRREAALLLEERPTIYRYTQTFKLPRFDQSFSRTSIIALIKVEPYSNGIVLPHEQTFPKHKEDRLRILEATRAHLECIFGLYEDPDGKVLDAITHAPVGSTAKAEADGIGHVLEPIVDEDVLNSITSLLADKKVWIADGHHRYETALAFRAALGEREGPVAEDYMMMALSSMSDPGLVLLPTHRIVSNMKLSKEQALAKLGEVFDIHATHSTRAYEMLHRAAAEGQRAFAVCFEGGLGYYLTPKNDSDLVSMVEGDGTEDLNGLDVTLLHRVIFERLLGIKGLDDVSYTRDHVEALRLADMGNGVAFMMNPPSVDDMKRIALGGEKMPQKSTFYYPKLASGLVVWSLNDF